MIRSLTPQQAARNALAAGFKLEIFQPKKTVEERGSGKTGQVHK